MTLYVLIYLCFVVGYANSVIYKAPVGRIESLRERLFREGKWPAYYQQKLLEKANGSQWATDVDDLVYVSNITIGTPPQQFRIILGYSIVCINQYIDILDTGSSNLWVPDRACTSGACRGKAQYVSSASSTYSRDGRPWSIQYGTGTLGIDIVCLGESQLCYQTQIFGQATTVAQFFADEPLDGILGLGWPSISVDNVPPIMQNILPTLDLPLFTVWLDKRGPGSAERAGQFTYGALDTTHCQMNTLAYVPLSSQSYWQFVMDSVSCGTYSQNTRWQVISDTGTSLLGGPQAVCDGVARNIGATYDDSQGLYFMDCLAQGPPIVVSIGGQTYSMPFTEYVVPIGDNQCILGLFSIEGFGFGPSWILGDTFIRTFCQVYHIGDAKIGFAKAYH